MDDKFKFISARTQALLSKEFGDDFNAIEIDWRLAKRIPGFGYKSELELLAERLADGEVLEVDKYGRHCFPSHFDRPRVCKLKDLLESKGFNNTQVNTELDLRPINPNTGRAFDRPYS